MAYRVAKSILHLFLQWNNAHPNRSKRSDGTIGDAAHATRESDHNPWVKNGNVGVVTAGDYTHDPAHGADANALAEGIRQSQDPRVKYLIWNRRICRSYAKKLPNGHAIAPWTWASYEGSNPHTGHLHVSVQPEIRLYDDVRNWRLTPLKPPTGEDDMDMNTVIGTDTTTDPPSLMTMGKLVARFNAMYANHVDGDGVLSDHTLILRICNALGIDTKPAD